MLKTISNARKDSFPPARGDSLLVELKKNDPRFCRRAVRNYVEYFDRHGSLVSRLCTSGVKAWVVRGDRDEIGLSDEERRGLETCPNVRIVSVPDAAHFVMTDQPARTAEIILAVVSAHVRR